MSDNIETAASGPVPVAPPHTQHFLALDGLRGIAAVAVFLYHRRWWMNDGGVFIQHAYLAVDFFFMLSGLVVALAYERRLRDGRLSVRDFLLLRAIRLYPLIVLGALAGAAILCLQAALRHDTVAVIRTVGALPFAMLTLPIPSQLFAKTFALNEPSWSLFFEIGANAAFAIAAPWLSRRVLAAVIVLSGVALVLTAIDHAGLKAGWERGDLHVGAIRVSFSFCCGIALYRAHAAGRLPSLALPFWALGLLLIASFAPPLVQGACNTAFDLAMVAVVYPAIIVLGLGTAANRFWTPVMVASGAISYPIYIIHVPLLMWLEAGIWRLHLPNQAMLATAVAIGLPTAWLMGRYIDEPIRRRLRVRLMARGPN